MSRTEIQLVITARNEAGATLRRLSSQLGSVRKKFGTEMNMIRKATKYATVAVTGLTAAFGYFVKKAAFSAARIEELEVVLLAVAKANGVATDKAKDTVRQLRTFNIAHKQALVITNLFMQSEIDLADAIKLANVAKDLAVIASMDSSEATQTLIEATANQSILMLRQFGIVTNLDKIYGTYAEAVGKTADSLTEAEKKQAFLNEILDKGKKAAGSYEAAMGTVSKRYRSLTGRVIPDFIALLGGSFLETMGIVVDKIGNWTNSLQEVKEDGTMVLKPEIKELLDSIGKLISDGILEVIEKIEGWIEQMGGAKGISAKLQEATRVLREEIIPAIGKFISIVSEVIEQGWKHRKMILALIIAYEGLKVISVITGFLVSFKKALLVLATPLGLVASLILAVSAAAYAVNKKLDESSRVSKYWRRVIMGMFGPIGTLIDLLLHTKEAVADVAKEFKKVKDLGGSAWKKISGRQFGGSVTAGQSVMVGEHRPEVFVPSQSGNIKQVEQKEVTVNFNNVSVRNDNDLQSIVDAVKHALNQDQELNAAGAR